MSLLPFSTSTSLRSPAPLFHLTPLFHSVHFFTGAPFYHLFTQPVSHSVHFFTRPTFTTKYSPLKRNEYCKSSKSIYKYYLKLFHSGAHFFTGPTFHSAILFTQPTFSLGHFNIDYSPLKLYRMLQIIKFCLWLLSKIVSSIECSVIHIAKCEVNYYFSFSVSLHGLQNGMLKIWREKTTSGGSLYSPLHRFPNFADTNGILRPGIPSALSQNKFKWRSNRNRIEISSRYIYEYVSRPHWTHVMSNRFL